MALIIGAYFALWLHRRDRLRGGRLRAAQGGVLGAERASSGSPPEAAR